MSSDCGNVDFVDKIVGAPLERGPISTLHSRTRCVGPTWNTATMRFSLISGIYLPRFLCASLYSRVLGNTTPVNPSSPADFSRPINEVTVEFFDGIL